MRLANAKGAVAVRVRAHDIWRRPLLAGGLVEAVAALVAGLLDLGLDAVVVGVGVLADARHLPGDLDVRPVRLDDEAATFDLLEHPRPRPRTITQSLQSVAAVD